MRGSQRSAYDLCLKRLQNLLDLKTSPRNVDGQLLSDDEYEQQRIILLKKKATLEALLTTEVNPARPFHSIKDTLTMASRGRAELYEVRTCCEEIAST